MLQLQNVQTLSGRLPHRKSWPFFCLDRLNLILFMVDSKPVKSEDDETKVTWSDQEPDAPGDGEDVMEKGSHDALLSCDAPGDDDAVEDDLRDALLGGSVDAMYVNDG